ncbi:hypothetical protein GIV19_08770 [Pseudomonas syringae]|nr:hypothetical protein [Pseudomonas syringae]
MAKLNPVLQALWLNAFRESENPRTENEAVTVTLISVTFVTVAPLFAPSRPLAKLLLSARFLICHQANGRLLHNSKTQENHRLKRCEEFAIAMELAE